MCRPHAHAVYIGSESLAFLVANRPAHATCSTGWTCSAKERDAEEFKMCSRVLCSCMCCCMQVWLRCRSLRVSSSSTWVGPSLHLGVAATPPRGMDTLRVGSTWGKVRQTAVAPLACGRRQQHHWQQLHVLSLSPHFNEHSLC
jgi:hypothetical protein